MECGAVLVIVWVRKSRTYFACFELLFVGKWSACAGVALFFCKWICLLRGGKIVDDFDFWSGQSLYDMDKPPVGIVCASDFYGGVSLPVGVRGILVFGAENQGSRTVCGAFFAHVLLIYRAYFGAFFAYGFVCLSRYAGDLRPFCGVLCGTFVTGNGRDKTR